VTPDTLHRHRGRFHSPVPAAVDFTQGQPVNDQHCGRLFSMVRHAAQSWKIKCIHEGLTDLGCFASSRPNTYPDRRRLFHCLSHGHGRSNFFTNFVEPSHCTGLVTYVPRYSILLQWNIFANIFAASALILQLELMSAESFWGDLVLEVRSHFSALARYSALVPVPCLVSEKVSVHLIPNTPTLTHLVLCLP
jgi:hypothetical protein